MKTKLPRIQIGILCALLATFSCQGQTTVTQIAAGYHHVLFIKSDGSLWGLGGDYYGQLGDGTNNFIVPQPELIVSNGVTAVTARGDHSFYQIGSGLWAMGENRFGELGDGTTNNIHVPEQITGLIGIFPGYYHSLYLRSFGTSRELDAMGYNNYSQLGDGTAAQHSTPERIERDSTIQFNVFYITAVGCGDYHSHFIKSDGSLWGMGHNASGQLGDGTTNDQAKAEKILPGGVAAVSGGDLHTLILKTDGSLWGTGHNGFGQLGTPAVTNTFTDQPVLIVSNGVSAMVASEARSLFITSDGGLGGMGLNQHGELGDGTFNDAFQPERIVASGVTKIAAGDFFTLFLIADGSLWGMGDCSFGQLGPQYSTDQNRPVQIVGPIVGNGGFETRDFLGWTLEGSTNYNFSIANTPDAHSGACGAVMGQNGSLAYLSQSLGTTPGTNYLLSFWLNCNGITPNEFSVSWNGTNLMDLTNIPSLGWTNIQFQVAATTNNTLLKFGFRHDYSGPSFNYFDLDDVRVVPLSPPSITSIGVAGSNLVLGVTNGLWNGTYVTLMSTDLTQSVSQWTPVATNSLNGSGNFTVTIANAVNPGVPQQFYKLQLR